MDVPTKQLPGSGERPISIQPDCVNAMRSRRKLNQQAVRTLTRKRRNCSINWFAWSPDNVAAVLERARMAAKRSRRVVCFRKPSAASRNGWTAGLRSAVEQYRALQRAAAANDFAEAARAVAVLRNVLLRVPAFREDLLAIRTPAELIADPFDRFLSLPTTTSKPSPADPQSHVYSGKRGTAGALERRAVVLLERDGPPGGLCS